LTIRRASSLHPVARCAEAAEGARSATHNYTTVAEAPREAVEPAATDLTEKMTMREENRLCLLTD
jgi:hypothetical protein